ncbi:MAG: SIMPL domain-containing protein [Spongiibacteraceae bacterium]
MTKNLTLLFFVLYSSLSFSKENDNLIALTGVATISVIPDIIRLNVEISQLEKSDVSAAKNKVDTVSTKVAAALTSMGIKDEDITSSSLTVQTATRYDKNENPIPSGFSASREIEIVIRDIKMYSAVVQKLVDTGVTDIGDAQPDISDREELDRKALSKASEAARKKAEFLAAQFSAKLGKIHKIGDQRVDSRFNNLNEVIVTARRQKAENIKTIQYEFQPAPVEVKSSIYVEFELE